MKSSIHVSSSACRSVMMILVALILIAGCGRHPRATSRESLEFIKQVYTACNTKDSKRLATCKERLLELQLKENISKEEVKSFERLLETASQGEWETAQNAALQFARDQVR